MASPLEQFEIKPLVPIHIGSLDLSFTNSALMMTIAVGAATLFLVGGAQRAAAVPGRWQSAAELSYEFIAGLVRDNVGSAGRQFFPFVFSVFMFVLLGNLIGLIPFAFTFTSHIVVTFALAALVFILVTIVGFLRHGTHFFSFFMPTGVPMFMAPLIVPIELISYLSRPISLSVRLFANMMAGHLMLKVFAGFVVALGVLGGWAPLLLTVALTGFELLVAVLQAYVFAILTCIYLNDAIHLH